MADILWTTPIIWICRKCNYLPLNHLPWTGCDGKDWEIPYPPTITTSSEPSVGP